MKLFHGCAIIFLVSTLLSCVSVSFPDYEELKNKIQEEQAKKNKELHENIQNTWYGQIVALLYEEDEGAAVPRELDKREIAQLERLLNEVSKSIYKKANNHDDNFLDLFEISDVSKISFRLERKDKDLLAMRPDCKSKEIITTAKTIKELFNTVLSAKYDKSFSDDLMLLGLSMMDIDTPEDYLVVRGRYIDLLVGPPLYKAQEEQLQRAIASESTALWKSVGFIVAHEAAHIWSGQCAKNVSDDEQLKREYLADVFGVIIANEAFSKTCGLSVTLSDKLAESIIKKEQDFSHYSDASSYLAQIAGREMYASSSLFGVSGLEVMLNALSKFFSYDPTHLSPKDRVLVGAGTNKALTYEVFDQSVKDIQGSLIFKIAGLFGVTAEDYITGLSLEYQPESFFSSHGNICYKPNFEERDDNFY